MKALFSSSVTITAQRALQKFDTPEVISKCRGHSEFFSKWRPPVKTWSRSVLKCEDFNALYFHFYGDSIQVIGIKRTSNFLATSRCLQKGKMLMEKVLTASLQHQISHVNRYKFRKRSFTELAISRWFLCLNQWFKPVKRSSQLTRHTL